jgi:outer membrane lipoprotein-sorting protein
MISMAMAAGLACGGCAISQKTTVKPSEAPAPLQKATKEELIARYNEQARAITSINATVTMKLTAGSAYTGVIEQYHEINGFIIAAKPANVRVIGQAPVVSKNIFDMVSDGETFHIFIPSKNKFLEGPANLERQSAKPIENLRPQHLVDALVWAGIPDGAPVLFEEASEAANHYYVLIVVRAAGDQSANEPARTGSTDWEIAKEIWFGRADLRISRLENFAGGGKVISDVSYSDWQPAGASPEAAAASGNAFYPRKIALSRPSDDYEFQIGIKKLTVNETIGAERFVLKQPPGTELVKVGEDAKEPQQP